MHGPSFLGSALGALIAFFCAGCGDSASLEVVTGAPSAPGAAPTTFLIDAAEDVSALGARGSKLYWGASGGVYSLDVSGTALSLLEIWGDDPALPISTGPVRALGRRVENVLVAADAGLFHTSGDKLLVSPAQAALAGLGISAITALAVDAGANGERIWFGSASGLSVIEIGVLSAWAIEGASGAPTVLSPEGGIVYVAFGDKLFELDTAAGQATALAYDFGTIHAITRGSSGTTYVAADKGLFERSADGSFTQYTLSDSDPRAAWAAVFDPKKGVFAVTAAGIVLATPGAKPTAVAALPEGMTGARAAEDDIGNVWIGAGKRLAGLKIGSTVTFKEDVAPILEKYCATCHATGAQYAKVIDFADYEATKAIATVMVTRISTGSMPPAAALPMPAEDADVILRWEASGANQ